MVPLEAGAHATRARLNAAAPGRQHVGYWGTRAVVLLGADQLSGRGGSTSGYPRASCGVGVLRREGFAGREECQRLVRWLGDPPARDGRARYRLPAEGVWGRVRRRFRLTRLWLPQPRDQVKARAGWAARADVGGHCFPCCSAGAAYGPRAVGEGDDRRRPGRHIGRTPDARGRSAGGPLGGHQVAASADANAGHVCAPSGLSGRVPPRWAA